MRAVWVAGALMAVAAAAQDRPETVIRTTTRLVQIRVMAENANGDAVTDLRKEEIQLLDNRQPRPVQFLVREGISGAPGAKAEEAAPESPETRNDYAVIVLDSLNPAYADRLRAHDNVRKLLEHFQPRQQVALYLMAKQSRLLCDFTSHPSELLAALANTQEELEDPFSPSKPALPNDPRFKTWASLTLEERIFGFNNLILDSVERLGKLADGLGRLTGRKSMILLTNGFPIQLDSHALPGSKQETASYREFVEPLIDKLNRSNVALYTVDARGLPLGGYGDTDTLRELSERTGATAFFGRNDLDEGLRLAFEDSNTGYTLGFTLDSDAALGVHDIRLKTARRGVLLRYRESYRLDAR